MALIDEIMPTEPVENRIWLKLVLVKTLAVGDSGNEWSDVAKVKQKQK